jgi:hypothetical protein
MIALQGYLKTGIYAMGAQINERKHQKLKGSQATINNLTFTYHLRVALILVLEINLSNADKKLSFFSSLSR